MNDVNAYLRPGELLLHRFLADDRTTFLVVINNILEIPGGSGQPPPEIYREKQWSGRY